MRRARQHGLGAHARRADRDLHHGARALGAAAHLRVDRGHAAAARRMFERTEVVRALERRGFEDVRQRITGVTQFVGGRLAAARPSPRPAGRSGPRRGRGASRAEPNSDAVDLGALEEEVQVVLPGEADAAVHLQRRRRSRSSRRPRRRPWPSPPPAGASPARPRRPRPPRGWSSGRSRSRAACPRSGARPPGRRRSGGRTACGRARTRRPSPSPAARRRPARPRWPWRCGRAPGPASEPSGSPPFGADAREAARRVDRLDRLDLAVATAGAARGARRRPPSSTITSAESASGTSAASPSRARPTAPRASPEAMPGSHFARCSSVPACWSTRPAAAFDRNGTGASE